MSTIVNATLLVALAVVDQLDLLPQILGDVIVPITVHNEAIRQGLERPGTRLIAQVEWLQVESPQSTSTIEPFLLGLDPGELDVLLPAREQQPDWVIIDEGEEPVENPNSQFACGLSIIGL